MRNRLCRLRFVFSGLCRRGGSGLLTHGGYQLTRRFNGGRSLDRDIPGLRRLFFLYAAFRWLDCGRLYGGLFGNGGAFLQIPGLFLFLFFRIFLFGWDERGNIDGAARRGQPKPLPRAVPRLPRRGRDLFGCPRGGSRGSRETPGSLCSPCVRPAVWRPRSAPPPGGRSRNSVFSILRVSTGAAPKARLSRSRPFGAPELAGTGLHRSRARCTKIVKRVLSRGRTAASRGRGRPGVIAGAADSCVGSRAAGAPGAGRGTDAA